MDSFKPAKEGQQSLVTVRTQGQLKTLVDSGCSVAVASVQFTDQDGLVSSLVVRGIAAGSDTVDVAINRTSAAPQQVSIDSVSYEWVASFGLEPPADVGSIVRIETAAVDCNAADVVVFQLAPTLRYPATQGFPAGFEADRIPAIAGHPDRVVRSRSYSPLFLSGMFNYAVESIDIHVDTRIVGDAPARSQYAFTLSTSIFRRDSEAILEGFEERANDTNGVISMLAVRRALQDLAAETLTERAPTRTKESRNVGVTIPRGLPSFGRIQRPNADLRILEFDVEDNELVTEMTLPEQTAEAKTIARHMVAASIIFGISDFLKNTGWLGVLFYDEIHYRPVGKVIGEILYELSLAPAEEVHLSQRTASKRTERLENIRDREMERNLQFSSTWTQNVSQAETSATSASIGGNLGGSGQSPESPAGVNAGVNAQGAAEASSQLQVQRAYETSRQLASKMRERHTVTLDISSEEATDFTSKRTVRNLNQLRVLNLDYRKVYRKDRVLLERHDAKLCLGLRVDDPGHRSRQNFLDSLWKIHPDNPELYACAPGGQPIHEEDTFIRTINNSLQVPVMPGLLDAYAGGADVVINIEPSSSTSDLLLAGTPTVEVDRFIVRNWDLSLQELAPSEYALRGGQTSWREPRPRKLGAPAEYKLRVSFPRSQASLGLYATHQVRVHVTARWMREPSATADYWACIEGEQRRLREEFSTQAVFELAERIRRSSRDSVLSKLVATGFPHLNNPFVSQGTESLRTIFEWNEVQIEYLPWWLTASGSDNYEGLRQAILELPAALDPTEIIEDFLVASEAFVYVPIRPGCEEQALSLIHGELDDKFDKVVQDFRTYRRNHYGHSGHAAPSHASTSGPQASVGTPTGSDDWSNDWERPDSKFDVLAEWSEIFPTDGVSCEPSLSTGAAADELRTQQLRTVDPS